jgi:hypothetical protein
VVPVEERDGAAGPEHARSFPERREGVANVAQEHARHGGVEARRGEVELVHLADEELDAIADALGGSQSLGGGEELRALIDPPHGANEPVACCQRGALAEATGARESLVLVVGEPRIGKRLADVFSSEA